MSPILAASAPKALWYASRGTGIVCLLLLTLSVVLGIITTVRFETPHWPRFVLEGLHRNVSLLILLFVALHVATTVIDGFVPISCKQARVNSLHRSCTPRRRRRTSVLTMCIIVSSIGVQQT